MGRRMGGSDPTLSDGEENSGTERESMVKHLIKQSTRSFYLDEHVDTANRGDQPVTAGGRNVDGGRSAGTLENVKLVADSLLVYLGSCFRLLVALSVIPDLAPVKSLQQTLHTLQKMQVLVDELTMYENRRSIGQQISPIVSRIKKMVEILSQNFHHGTK